MNHLICFKVFVLLIQLVFRSFLLKNLKVYYPSEAKSSIFSNSLYCVYFTMNTITFKHTHTNNKNDFGSFKTWIYLREQNFLKIFKILNATLFRRCVAWWWWYWRWSSSSFFVSWLLQLLALTFFISLLTIQYIASMYIQLIYHF